MISNCARAPADITGEANGSGYGRGAPEQTQAPWSCGRSWKSPGCLPRLSAACRHCPRWSQRAPCSIPAKVSRSHTSTATAFHARPGAPPLACITIEARTTNNQILPVLAVCIHRCWAECGAHRCSGVRLVERRSCATAIMPLRGVRISWLMLARNMLFASVAVSAATCAPCASSALLRANPSFIEYLTPWSPMPPPTVFD